MPSVLPSPGEYAALAPRPGSPVWRAFNDPPPNLPGLRPGLWGVVSRPMALQLRVSTVGLLPPVLRERLGLPFSRADRRLFGGLRRVARATGPLIRGPLGEFGPHYVRWRRAALARGDVAGGTATRREPVATAA